MSNIELENYHKEFLVRVYRKMVEARIFDEKLLYLFATERVPGTMHPGIGQEAIPVGTSEALKKNDYLFPSHRGHGYFLARGVSPKVIMAEIFGKKNGLCKGMGGDIHLADLNARILGINGIIGSQISLAAGVGLAIRLREEDDVVVCVFGEGASNTGYFHEGINLASVWNLPVVYICENNLYAVSTHISKTMKTKNIAARASAYDIPGKVVDGNDVLAVYEAISEVVEKTRRGGGPSLIECKTYRYKGHSRLELAKYRPQEEVKAWLKKDPISNLEAKLVKRGILSPQKIRHIKEETHRTIEQVVIFAKNSNEPLPESGARYVFV